MSRRIAPACMLAVASSCGGTSPPSAASLATPPAFDPVGQARCGVVKSQDEPLVVEWPSASRAKLEAQARAGLVAVRYQGCEMEVLGGCSARGRYGYRPITIKHDRVTVRDTDELYARLPLGAVSLEGTLQRAGQLSVDMTIVGRWEHEAGGVSASELAGDCARATHVVTGLTAGAFRFFTGAEASVGGGAGGLVQAGASTSAAREVLAEDGNESACARSSGGDTQPPFGCGAILRLEVVPIGQKRTAARPDCPEGTGYNGTECVAFAVKCPGGTYWDGTTCIGSTPGPPIAPGFHCYKWVSGTKAMEDTTHCFGTLAYCELARSEMRARKETASMSECFTSPTATCFLHERLACYLDKADCERIAPVFVTKGGCEPRTSYRW